MTARTDKSEHRQCFVIMPVTTPTEVVPGYGGDQDHFRHVLHALFVPAIKRAGLHAVSPMMSGSDIIHAQIIQNLEQSDLVLCDMSASNPNVFYELGIRTALNKPVCLVVDDRTANVPFDTVVMNHLQYRSNLAAWNLESEIDKLAQHIAATLERNPNQNTMWRYFGLSTVARIFEREGGADDRLKFLETQLQAIQEYLREHLQDSPPTQQPVPPRQPASPPPSHNRRRSVFISYSHADQGWLDRVRVHLKPLERNHTIEVWSDTMIQSGQNWREEIATAVDNARVALLLISADFLASDFIVNNELPPLLAKAANDNAVILPLILKPSRFLREDTLSCYQSVNDPQRPLLQVSEAGREAILVKLSEEIERIVQT